MNVRVRYGIAQSPYAQRENKADRQPIIFPLPHMLETGWMTERIVQPPVTLHGIALETPDIPFAVPYASCNPLPY